MLLPKLKPPVNRLPIVPPSDCTVELAVTVTDAAQVFLVVDWPPPVLNVPPFKVTGLVNVRFNPGLKALKTVPPLTVKVPVPKAEFVLG